MLSSAQTKHVNIFAARSLMFVCRDLDDHLENSRVDTALQSTGGLNDSFTAGHNDELTDRSHVKTPVVSLTNKHGLRLSSSMNNISNMGMYVNDWQLSAM
jgi:hypothetical protein